METRKAFLTIDDCPSACFKEKVDYLTAASIPAVFFCNGALLEKRPHLAKYAIEKGYVIANHSYSHADFDALDPDACRREIESTDSIIEQLYEDLAVSRPGRYFRFPYGHIGTPEDSMASQACLKGHGYSPPGLRGVARDSYVTHYARGLLDWTWTCDTQDWKLQADPRLDPEDFVAQVKAAVDGHFHKEAPHSSEIILMHDHERSHPFFATIIETILPRKLELVTPR